MITRDYYPIWNKLKSLPRKEAEEVGVSLIINRAFFARVLKAVVKEKWMDIGFKILMYESGYRTTLMHKKELGKITFFLKYERIITYNDLAK